MPRGNNNKRERKKGKSTTYLSFPFSFSQFTNRIHGRKNIFLKKYCAKSTKIKLLRGANFSKQSVIRVLACVCYFVIWYSVYLQLCNQKIKQTALPTRCDCSRYNFPKWTPKKLQKSTPSLYFP